MLIDVPGYGQLDLRHLVLDLNGTIALDGALLPGVAEDLRALDPSLQPLLVTADTHGRAAAICEELGIEPRIIGPGDETAAKERLVRELGTEHVVAIGNGANDASLLAAAALGICVIGPEGASAAAMRAADVVVTDIRAALGLLLTPSRLIATLRR